MSGPMRAASTALSSAQGWYYLLGGLWRLIHPRSFEAVSGPKPDSFQTDVAAALFAAIGAGLLTRPTRVLAASSGLSVAFVDLKYRHAIRPIFLAEAAFELAFAAAATRPVESPGRTGTSVMWRPRCPAGRWSGS